MELAKKVVQENSLMWWGEILPPIVWIASARGVHDISFITLRESV